MKLLECLLLHSNDGKIAADDGGIDAIGVRAPGLGGPALVRGGNWPRGPGLGPRPWGHRCADDGWHGGQAGEEEVFKENKTQLPARGGSRGRGEVGGTVSSERKMSTSTFEAEAHQMVTQRLSMSKAPPKSAVVLRKEPWRIWAAAVPQGAAGPDGVVFQWPSEARARDTKNRHEER